MVLFSMKLRKTNNVFELFQLVRSHKSEEFKDVRALCFTVIDSGHARLISEPANRPASLLKW